MLNERLNDVLTTLRNKINEASPTQVKELLKAGAILVDVREESEIRIGTISGAYTPGRSNLEHWLTGQINDIDETIVLFCAGGARSLLAAQSLINLGYLNVITLAGGLSEWKACGYEIETPVELSSKELSKYSRHLLLPEIGILGQRRLKQSKVLIVGLGGLGSPCAYYLTAAGLGELGIIDHDKVDLSNLQRQILFCEDDVGEKKSVIAKKVLERLNSSVVVNAKSEQLNKDNAVELFSDYNLIVDCTDNFSARYIISDTALELGIPVVHGSIYHFIGQVGVFNTEKGPCYRCVFPEPPPKELSPTCSEAGVLGVLPGVVGLLQATEVIKFLLNIGTVQSTYLLQYNGLHAEIKKLRIKKRENCKCNNFSITKEQL